MMKNKYFLVLMLIVLSVICIGCSTFYGSYSSFKKNEPLVPKDKARIYVYREHAIFGIAIMYPFEVDETDKLYLPNKSFAVLDLDSGDHKFQSGLSEIIINLQAGSVYYIRLSNTEGYAMATMPGAVVGATSLGAMSAMTSVNADISRKVGGPYTLTLIESIEAIKVLDRLGFKGVYAMKDKKLSKTD